MTRKKTQEEFVAEVEGLVGVEYTVLGEYKNNRTHLTMRHNTCGNEYPVTPYKFLFGRRCPICMEKERAIRRRKPHGVFVNQVKELGEGDYELVSDYELDNVHVDMLHKKCGKVYPVKPSNFLQGYRCPRCKESKGERYISSTLHKNYVAFIRQYRCDCRYKHTLPFDFAILSNDKVVCLIEYDGRQHFEPVTEWGGRMEFTETQKRDTIKTQYCTDNNIPLIRIPYWDFDNIDEILTKELRKLGVIGTQDIAA